MALETATYTFDRVRLPQVVLTVETSDLTGLPVYTAVVNLLELDPSRTVSFEESLAGITELNPPTVTSNDPQTLIDLAVRACGSSYDATDGLTFDAEALASIGYSVPAAVAGALRMAGVEV